MDYSPKTLLVIDDDIIVRQSIAVYLEDSGFEVHQESSGHSGLEWFHANKPDGVITDLRMPDLDGLVVLEKIHQVCPETPVIVVSGMGVVGDVVRALRLGASDYFLKPLVDVEVLVHALKKAFETIDLRQENESYRDQLEVANRSLEEYVIVLEKDQLAGRRVQSKLLPNTPKDFGNINLHYTMIPSLYLSGDFIDYNFISERYIAFYLADVSGHGAAPAFMTVWLKLAVQRLIREQDVFTSRTSFDKDLVGLVKEINRQMIVSKFDSHLTCFVGVMDVQTREMHYVICGHLPMPLLISSGKTQYLEGKGKPLGIFKDAEWEMNAVTLPYKFSLVVFSDGVLEVLPPEELVDKEHYLANLLSGYNGGSAEDIRDLLKLSNEKALPDDISIFKIESGGMI